MPKRRESGLVTNQRSESPTRAPGTSRESRNVVIFGESGVGKSSLINAIAGYKVARTSSSAVGCTFRWSRQEVEIDGVSVGIWDTAGLDEGTYGTVPAPKAEENLKRLLRELGTSNGIDLLVYCVRGTRVRKALLKNYSIFYSAICRKKAPIVIVVTGLENQEGEMEDWWTKNEAEFTRLKMRFDGHACVTTLDPDIAPSERLRDRCVNSRKALRQLILDNCSAERWGDINVGTWLKAALLDVRSTVKRQGQNPSAIPNVVLYDITAQKLDDLEGTRGEDLMEGWLAKAGDDPFYVYRIRDPDSGTHFTKKVTSRGADLLIFCVDAAFRRSSAQWHFEHFRNSFGGHLTPLIVVVNGVGSREAAQQWWAQEQLSGDGRAHRNAYIAHLPNEDDDSDKTDRARRKLQEVLKRLCLDTDDTHGASPWCFRLGGKNVTKFWGRLRSHDDLLTRSNVWVSG
ncbi:P-loop containing nucleoside triphosphate hydrolase protein [Leucogyrophana mollusca]|uniref:P-loop containing nucleoside triphosphate hydrolase protein n=1 Tax=Leucogyrophana mollusca TaxID=85980 RepID=A0ACB8BTG2_9AGAM|nr:P-loop containing nucleoside triphosphate hydrolase protein [Leucogyrophana mollusca]